MLNIPGEFGRQTVGFVTATESGSPGYLGVREKTFTTVAQSGVRFRPLRTDELDKQTDVSTEMWKLTAPVSVAALAAKSTGEIVYDGTDSPTFDEEDDSNVFTIDGFIQPKPGMYGGVHHITIMCGRKAG